MGQLFATRGGPRSSASALRRAFAQGTYPSRRCASIIPFTPGGVGDISSRVVADKLGDIFGRRRVDTPRLRANATISAEVIAQGRHRDALKPSGGNHNEQRQHAFARRD